MYYNGPRDNETKEMPPDPVWFYDEVVREAAKKRTQQLRLSIRERADKNKVIGVLPNEDERAELDLLDEIIFKRKT